MSVLVLDEWLRNNLLQSFFVNPGGASGKQSVSPVDVSRVKFGGSVELGGFEKEPKDKLVFALDRKINNPGPTEEIGKFIFKKSETYTVSTSVTEGLSISETSEVNLSVKLPADVSFGVKEGVTVTMNGSTTETQTQTEVQEWDVEEDMVCPPYTFMTTSIYVTVADYRAGFFMNGPITGNISFKVTNHLKDGSSLVAPYDGPIERFIPGMPLTPQMSIRNNKFLFHGSGQMTVAEGISIVRENNFQPIPHAAGAAR
jgi:hypothetical protein